MILLINQVHPQIITVKQDGTGDYTVIQEAVDDAINSDTILIYPGIYYENLDLTNKGIVLAGTWLMNQEDSLINQTIIDGNHNGSCIKSLTGTQWNQIIGLTLQHGSGTNTNVIKPYYYGNGGGILVKNSMFRIQNCRVTDNFASYGAGICSNNSSLELSGNSIYNNWAAESGGGVRIATSVVSLDTFNLNNIYCNYASYGADISIAHNDTPNLIYLDTATVSAPDSYYIGKYEDHAIIIDGPPVFVQHGKISQVNQDLYVSPYGCDDNSGLSAIEPLKTISFALLKIASDSLNIKTIHIAQGLYSPSTTGEHTPLQLKNYVNLIGQSIDSTILDCENKFEGARFAFGQEYTLLKNITFLNGNGYYTGNDGGISSGYSNKLIIDNVCFDGTTGEFTSTIYSDSDDTLIVKNSSFINCKGYKGISLFVKPYDSPRYNEFISCKFSENKPDTSYDQRHLTLYLSGSSFNSGWNNTVLVNCLFNDNTDSLVWVSGGGSVAINTNTGSELWIINSTFTNNRTVNNPSGGAIGAVNKSTINLFNSVLYGNYACQAYLANNTEDEADTMWINYSLIQDGQAGVRDYGTYNQVVWGEGNKDGDPLFYGSGEHPYSIDFGSPCIDAGTTDLPPWIDLPEYDIAGNPRVYGESVDMGAYEYGPWVNVPEAPNSGIRNPESGLLVVSPNPSSYGTYISFELKSSGRLNISIFSSNGILVKTLVNYDAGPGEKAQIYWDGTGQGGNILPGGAYFVRMTIDGKRVAWEKVVMIR